MARTRWPPGSVTPASCTGQADQTGSTGGCQRTRAPAGRSIRKTTSRRQPIRRPSRDPGPALPPHHRKPAEAGPNHHPHPPCRLCAEAAGGHTAACSAQSAQLCAVTVANRRDCYGAAGRQDRIEGEPRVCWPAVEPLSSGRSCLARPRGTRIGHEQASAAALRARLPPRRPAPEAPAGPGQPGLLVLLGCSDCLHGISGQAAAVGEVAWLLAQGNGMANLSGAGLEPTAH